MRHRSEPIDKFQDLRERIAAVLKWSANDTMSFSFVALREFVRSKDPKLAEEISEIIQRGEHLTM